MEMMSVTRFKQSNRSRNVTGPSVGVRKQMIAPADTLTEGIRSLRFTISTDCIDRERDCISLAGWSLDNFRRNPVVLWGHDATKLPIGRAFNVGIVDGALKASVEFIPADTPEAGGFAEAVYQLAKSGYIAATSVGFRPIKWKFTEDPERGADDWFPGIDFELQELIELSVVTVPANPDALIEPAHEVASDMLPVTGEEVTGFNEEQARARARRRRVFQLIMAAGA